MLSSLDHAPNLLLEFTPHTRILMLFVVPFALSSSCSLIVKFHEALPLALIPHQFSMSLTEEKPYFLKSPAFFVASVSLVMLV